MIVLIMYSGPTPHNHRFCLGKFCWAQVENIQEKKKKKTHPESFKKPNMKLPHIGNHFHSNYTGLGNLEMI